MIVYNVKRRWFALKHDAVKQRITEKLPETDVLTLEISNRDQLAAFLDALCAPEIPTKVSKAAKKAFADGSRTENAALKKIGVTAHVDPDKDIAAFLRRKWNKFAKRLEQPVQG